MPDDYAGLINNFTHIAIALMLGLLVGSERGWHGRKREPGKRSTGVRTFILIALLGGVVATGVHTLNDLHRWLICALIFIPVSICLIVAYYQSSRTGEELGMTTEVAAMLTYWFGVLPAFGMALEASATAVVVALLLHLKKPIHHYLALLENDELTGALQFLLISVVLLPLLPDQGFGPWQALNPYQLWWMVVLISGLSLLGYFAMRLADPGKGIIATSLAGGLASSTALTLSLSRLYKEISNRQMIASGILLACAMMFLRILLVVFVLNRDLFVPLLMPMLSGATTLFLAAFWYWHQSDRNKATQKPTIKNPFNLIPALQFAGLLAIVMLASEGLQIWLGDSGLYLLSFFTGLSDVDAIVLSLAAGAGQDIVANVVILSIAIAASTNTLVKALYSRIIAGAELGKVVLGPTILASAIVLLAVLI